MAAIQNISDIRKHNNQVIAEKYDWSNIVKVYDRELIKHAG